jgi:hypothetical protein
MWLHRRHQVVLLAIIGYGVVLLFFYTLFKRFSVGYVVEFLLPLHILAGYALCVYWKHMVTRVLASVIIVSSFVLSFSVLAGTTQNPVIIRDYHYRRHPVNAIVNASTFIQQQIPADQEIFSGNTIFAANSNYRLVMDLAHPQFDYHDFPSKKKQKALLNYLIKNDIHYVVEDYKMQFFFYKRNPLIEEYIDTHFHTVYYDTKNSIRILQKN